MKTMNSDKIVQAAFELIADTRCSDGDGGREKLYHALKDDLGPEEMRRRLDAIDAPLKRKHTLHAAALLRSWGYTVVSPHE